MEAYDLNLCVGGGKDQTKREAIALAMQMGYIGIATVHTVVGIMSDSDRCKNQVFAIDKLLSAFPGVEQSVKFHREIIGVPARLAFRQYSRLTVLVDDQVQAAALNPANPVLQTYDLVAVRPLNQKMFVQACNQLEVDLISLDLSQKLPFRIQAQMVKAAVERGIFFEISYGPSMMDVKARRDLFVNAQMLINATHGKNVIVCSGAKMSLEMRGPNDVINMSTLFGLSMEHAKAAVSSNCKFKCGLRLVNDRRVLLHGYARRKTHKGAIAVVRKEENMLFEIPGNWDPLSKGDDDCYLPVDTIDVCAENYSTAAAALLKGKRKLGVQQQQKKKKKKSKG